MPNGRIHPQIKADLSADEWKELGELMSKVTTIVGHRFSQILGQTEPARLETHSISQRRPRSVPCFPHTSSYPPNQGVTHGLLLSFEGSR